MELFYEGKWREVGGYRYTLGAAVARVACRQVGYPYSNGTRDFGRRSGPVWVVIRSCNGDEERVEQCEHYGWRRVHTVKGILAVSCRGECLQGVRYIHRNTSSVYMCFEENPSACHTISSAIPQVQRRVPLI